MPSILFLSKTTDWCRLAEHYLRTNIRDVGSFTGERGEGLPSAAGDWSGDYVISFVSPWIVPASLLSRARLAALNFHPGPPEYPGIGCYNFALYDEVSEYGVTCHHMAPKVDSGAIAAVRRFPVLPTDTVETLKDRSMVTMLQLFYEVVSAIASGADLPASDERWQRRPYTRRELEELGRVTPEMDAREVHRRVRAMRFPGYPGAFIDIAGVTFRA